MVNQPGDSVPELNEVESGIVSQMVPRMYLQEVKNQLKKISLQHGLDLDTYKKILNLLTIEEQKLFVADLLRMVLDSISKTSLFERNDYRNGFTWGSNRIAEKYLMRINEIPKTEIEIHERGRALVHFYDLERCQHFHEVINKDRRVISTAGRFDSTTNRIIEYYESHGLLAQAVEMRKLAQSGFDSKKDVADFQNDLLKEQAEGLTVMFSKPLQSDEERRVSLGQMILKIDELLGE